MSGFDIPEPGGGQDDESVTREQLDSELALYSLLSRALTGDLDGTLEAPELRLGVVTDAHIATLAAIQRSKLAAVEAFRAVGDPGQPAFTGTWSNFGGGYTPASFWKDESSGLVHLRGLVKSTGTDVNVFTLPVGYRPAINELLNSSKVVVATVSVEQVTISTAGVVAVATAAAHVTQILSGMYFRAA